MVESSALGAGAFFFPVFPGGAGVPGGFRREDGGVQQAATDGVRKRGASGASGAEPFGAWFGIMDLFSSCSKALWGGEWKK